jgi:hypothetical protein
MTGNKPSTVVFKNYLNISQRIIIYQEWTL